jgi:hypothetical protein
MFITYALTEVLVCLIPEGNILKQAMASGLVFQAIGFGCLFFLLFQEWRSRKRGTLT